MLVTLAFVPSNLVAFEHAAAALTSIHSTKLNTTLCFLVIVMARLVNVSMLYRSNDVD
jgi:hypothetical protein